VGWGRLVAAEGRGSGGDGGRHGVAWVVQLQADWVGCVGKGKVPAWVVAAAAGWCG